MPNFNKINVVNDATRDVKPTMIAEAIIIKKGGKR